MVAGRCRYIGPVRPDQSRSVEVILQHADTTATLVTQDRNGPGIFVDTAYQAKARDTFTPVWQREVDAPRVFRKQ